MLLTAMMIAAIIAQPASQGSVLASVHSMMDEAQNLETAAGKIEDGVNPADRGNRDNAHIVTEGAHAVVHGLRDVDVALRMAQLASPSKAEDARALLLHLTLDQLSEMAFVQRELMLLRPDPHKAIAKAGDFMQFVALRRADLSLTVSRWSSAVDLSLPCSQRDALHMGPGLR
jgi:hypothetical protein